MKTRISIIYKVSIAIALLLLITMTSYAQMSPLALPSAPAFPDPLLLRNESPVENLAQWEQQKEWIKDNLQKYILGYIPPLPQDIQSKVLEIRYEGNVKIEAIELRFGRDFKAIMNIELFFPADIEGKLPVVMTQRNHKGWTGIGLQRGYIGCIYAAADVKDDTQNYGDLYPEYSFGRLMQRAWGASAVVSYLMGREEIQADKIAITGHSRNGKQALYAAAFDERIAAVIPSSSGFGGVRAARHSDRRFSVHDMNRTLLDFPEWWIPELKAFYGHEDRLPVDMNSLLALMAPRPCLLNAGIFDLYGDAWGLEQTYHSAKRVYDFLGHSDKLQIRQKTVRHNTHARDIEDFFDFLDTQFGIHEYPLFFEFYHQHSFEDWLGRQVNKEWKIPAKTDISALNDIDKNDISHIRANIEWLLGDAPSNIRYRIKRNLVPGTKEDNLATMFRTQESIGKAQRIRISPYSGMGDQLYADFYHPATGKDQYPVVVYLHEYAYAEGYGRSSYPGFEMNEYINEMIEAGFAVLAFDMIGFGTRQAEATRFYQRYPQSPLL